MLIRREEAADAKPIRDLIALSFRDAAHSSGTEASIVDRLRDAGALTVSLVAFDDDVLVGHVAFSPVSINGWARDWYGLGPLAVRSDRQRRGAGRRLVETGLDELEGRGAGGCVVLGDPGYYRRFGFEPDPDLFLAGVPMEYFQRRRFHGEAPAGEVRYHPAFGVV